MSGRTILEEISKPIICGEDGLVFATGVALKDVLLFSRLATDTKSPSFLADAVREIYQLTSLAGLGDKDVLNVRTMLRTSQPVKVREGAVETDFPLQPLRWLNG